MKYRVKLFASLKDKTGNDVWEHNCSESLTGSSLLALFFDQYPALTGLRKVTRLAVNQSFCNQDPTLQESDELALIPPVSGG